MMHDFAEEECVPCQEGAIPLKREDMVSYLDHLDSRWGLNKENTRLNCQVKTKDFKEAFNYAAKISEMADQQWHHPVLTIGFGFLNVEIWTHKIDALVASDFIFAAKVDKILSDV